MDALKRGRGESGLNANGGVKKYKPEVDSLSSGIGSKSKPCTKFFSTAGCPFGESCHFLHFVPGGYNTVAQMMNLAPAPSPRTMAGPPSNQNGSASSSVKTKMCNKFNTADGCKFGDSCRFAHGEWQISKPNAPFQEDHRGGGAIPGHFIPQAEPLVPGLVASFGASTTAKISIDTSLVGAIIGKGGLNSKQISRQTGARLSIRDHETNPNLKNVELEGTFEQIKLASSMVRDLVMNIGSSGPPKSIGAPHAGSGGVTTPGSNYKTKLCENFSKGSCTFGERCHFAHGTSELRKTVL